MIGSLCMLASLTSSTSEFMTFAAWASIPLVATVVADQGRGEGPRLPGRVEEVLRWLPEDTETLMVARGPFGIDASILPDKTDRWVDVRGFFRSPAIGAYSELAREHPELFRGRPVEFAVAGCRNFREPGAGDWGVEGGYIAFFRDDVTPLMRSLVGEEIEEAGHLEHAVGEVEIRGKALFLAQPRPHVLIVATDRAFLETMLGRMADRPASRALPPGLPEWRYVDPAAENWGFRHVRPGGFHLGYSAKGVLEADFEAIGATYCYDPAEGVAEFAFLSGVEHVAASAEHFWALGGEMPFPVATRAVAPDVAVTRLPVPGRIDKDNENTRFALNLGLSLFMWCGYVIVI